MEKAYNSLSRMKRGRSEYFALRFSIRSTAASFELRITAGVRKNLAKTTSPVEV